MSDEAIAPKKKSFEDDMAQFVDDHLNWYMSTWERMACALTDNGPMTMHALIAAMGEPQVSEHEVRTTLETMPTVFATLADGRIGLRSDAQTGTV